MLGSLLCAYRDLRAGRPLIRRDPRWPAERKAWLARHPTCEACGSRKSPEVHHRWPVHLYPERELDSRFYMTLCEEPGRECHLRIGHSWLWTAYNVKAVEDAALSLRRVDERVTVRLQTGGLVMPDVSHPDLYPYPESLPASLWPHLIEILNGKLPTAKEAAHYLWHGGGYGLFLWTGQEPPVMTGAELSREQCAHILEAHLKVQTEMGKAALPVIPWTQIAIYFMEILIQVLRPKS